MFENNATCFNPPIDNLVWCFGVQQTELFEKIKLAVPGAIFVEGFPAQDIRKGTVFPSSEGHNLLVMDDLMQEVGDSETFGNIWTKVGWTRCKHRVYWGCVPFSVQPSSWLQCYPHFAEHVSTWVGNANSSSQFNSYGVVQLHKGWVNRAKSGLFPRFGAKIWAIQLQAREIYPGNGAYLVDAYEKATTEAFGYLLLDFIASDKSYRLRSHIFPVHISSFSSYLWPKTDTF